MALQRKVTVFPVRNGDMEFSFAVLDERGAVELRFAAFATHEVADELRRFNLGEELIRARGVECHSATPMYEGQPVSDVGRPCWLLGKPCYHDGTSSWAINHVLPGLKAHGTDWLWPVLEARHRDQFGEPTP